MAGIHYDFTGLCERLNKTASYTKRLYQTPPEMKSFRIQQIKPET